MPVGRGRRWRRGKPGVVGPVGKVEALGEKGWPREREKGEAEGGGEKVEALGEVAKAKSLSISSK